MGGNGGEVGHADGFASLVSNDRNSGEQFAIAGEPHPHLLQEAGIDLIDQFEMAWQQRGE